MTTTDTGLVRNVLAVLIIAILTASTYWILEPFLVSLIWALTIAVATWPTVLRLQGRFGGRRGPAATVMTLGLLSVVVVPLIMAVVAIVDRSEEFAGSLAQVTIPRPPSWVRGLPVVGAQLADRWDALAVAGAGGLTAKLAPHVRELAQWFMAKIGGMGATFAQMLLTVMITAIMYMNGDGFARAIRRFAARVGGTAGEDAVGLAGQAIRKRAEQGIVIPSPRWSRASCSVTSRAPSPARTQRAKGLSMRPKGARVFLDEIGELPLDVQPRCCGSSRPSGWRGSAATTKTVDVRVVAATNRDLEQSQPRALPPDLFYRLAVVRLRVPPLRERPEEILPLVRALRAGPAASRTAAACGDQPRGEAAAADATPGRATCASCATSSSAPW